MSYNRDMENEKQINDIFTKANESGELGVFLNGKDADEYRAYKRRKKMTEVALAIARSQGSLFCGEDVQRVCERALRLKQAAIQLPLSKLAQAKSYLAGGFVRLDCVVGGDGETLAKVKAYEARLAAKRGAKEITVAVTPSLFDGCRYGEIRKELKLLKKAVGKSALKVRVEKINAPTSLSRLARICSEIGARYLSVPYFVGCERLRLDLTNGCLLQVTGVERVDTYQKLASEGVERIGTDRAWEIYNDWIREANETPICEVAPSKKKENNTGNSVENKGQEIPKEEGIDKLPPCLSAVKILAAHERAKEEEQENKEKAEKPQADKKELDVKLL